MLRVTVELLAKEDAADGQVLGVMDLAIVDGRPDGTADYAVYLKKKPPFENVLQQAKLKGLATYNDRGRTAGMLESNNDEGISTIVTGPNRIKGGIFNLVFRALKACGAETQQV